MGGDSGWSETTPKGPWILFSLSAKTAKLTSQFVAADWATDVERSFFQFGDYRGTDEGPLMGDLLQTNRFVLSPEFS